MNNIIETVAYGLYSNELNGLLFSNIEDAIDYIGIIAKDSKFTYNNSIKQALIDTQGKLTTISLIHRKIVKMK